jgi:hypothetical protein
MTNHSPDSSNTGDDHQSAIHDAVGVLQQGFLKTNDLEVREDGTITPESLAFEGTDGDAFTRDDLTQQSWVYVARLLFVAFGESRGLLQPETSPNSRSYRVELSLCRLQNRLLEWTDSPKQASNTHLSIKTTQWMRLDQLFSRLYEGDDSLRMNAFGYDLFDPEEHPFLHTHVVSNPHLAEVIFLLSTTQTEDGYERVDYSRLSLEQVATLCEGAAEQQLRAALMDLVSIIDESENPGESHE